jgi:hypothetical protein
MVRTSYILFACFCLFTDLADAATDNWTGGTGNWADASNWTNSSNQHVIPASGDNVQIVNNDGVSRTITNVYDYTIPVTTLGSLTVDLTGGSGSATNTLDTSAASMVVTGNEVVGNLGSGTLLQSSNYHTVNGSISIGAQAGSTGAYTVNGLTTAGAVYVGGSSAGAGGAGTLAVNGELDVNGTLTAYNTPGSSITLSNVSYNNTISATALNFNGTPSLFNWQNGRLILNSDVTWYGGAPATSTSAAFGNSLSLNNGKTLIVNGNETIGGLGTFSLDVGNSSHTVNGTLTVAQGGTLVASTSLYAPTVIQSGGTIYGTLVNTGSFTYQNGTFGARLVNRGTVDLGSNFTANGGIENDTDMTLSGAVNFGSGIDNFGNLAIAGATLGGYSFLTNEVSGSITAHGSIQGGVNNYGRFTLDGFLSLTYNPFTNNGILQGNGTLSVISGNGFTNAASGIINVAAGNALAITTNWNNLGLVNLQGSGALLGGYITNSQNPIQITNTGTIQGSGIIAAKISNNGTLRASGGELDLTASGNSNNNSNSSIQISAGSTMMFLQGLSNNSGTISITGGTFDNNNHTLSNGTSSAVINGYGTIRTGGLFNSGKLNVGEGNMDIFGNVTNNGSIGIQGGRSLYFYGNVSGSGSFTGAGTATFLAALSPGNSPAAVSFGGNADLTSVTALNIEIGGTTAGSQYDRLDVAGQLLLGGALNVSLINTFKPTVGNTFDILNWNSLNGTFSGGINLPALTGAVAWDTSALYTTGALSVVATYKEGDFNRDGHVDTSDTQVAMNALTDLTGYESQYGITAATLPQIGDINGDGSFTIADMQMLLINLKSGGGSQNSVPEPASFTLLSAALLLGSFALQCGRLRRNCR